MLYAGVCLQGRDRSLKAALDLGFHRYLIMWEAEYDARWLAENDPQARFLLRCYDSDRMERRGKERAEQDVERAVRLFPGEVLARIEGVTPANELNHPGEHARVHPSGSWQTEAAYNNIDSWLVEWADYFRPLAKEHGWTPRLYWPALSPRFHIQGLPLGNELALVARSMAAYDVICFHVYGAIEDPYRGSGLLAHYVSAIRSLGLQAKPMVVSEVNQVNFAEFCRWASTLIGVEGAFYFGWRMNQEFAHRNLIGPHAGGIREYLAEGGAGNGPPPPNQSIEYIDGIPVAWGFLKEYIRRCRSDGRPNGPEVHCGPASVQSFASGAIYVWDGGRVHVLCDTV